MGLRGGLCTLRVMRADGTQHLADWPRSHLESREEGRLSGILLLYTTPIGNRRTGTGRDCAPARKMLDVRLLSGENLRVAVCADGTVYDVTVQLALLTGVQRKGEATSLCFGNRWTVNVVAPVLMLKAPSTMEVQTPTVMVSPKAQSNPKAVYSVVFGPKSLNIWVLRALGFLCGLEKLNPDLRLRRQLLSTFGLSQG